MRRTRPGLAFLLLLLLSACVMLLPTTATVAEPEPTSPPAVPATLVPPVLVDVRTFGAQCDGVADDTAAIQSAADASVGKALYFPAGTCRVFSVNIPSGASVTGEGPASVVQQLTLTTVNDPRPVFDAGSNVTVSNIKIDGNRVANRPDRWSDAYDDAGRGFKNSVCCGRGRGYRAGIRGESITGLTVDSVEFTGIAGAALATINSSNVTLANSNIHDTDFEAAYITGDGFPVRDVSGTNINVVDNTITNLQAPPEAGGTQPNGIVISRAIGGTVSGNTLKGVDRDFLKLEADQNFTVSDNHATTGRIGYPSMAIQPMYNRHDLGSRNIRVTGNHFSGPGFQAGVQVNSSGMLTSVAQNIEIDHNTISGVKYGVLTDGNIGLDTIRVSDNVFFDISGSAIYENGGGTNLTINANTVDGRVLRDVVIPGTFQTRMLIN